MRVRFTKEARTRLRQIHNYITADSPTNAAALLKRLIERAESLSELSARGRPVAEYKDDRIREILERPYRIVYRTLDDEVQILTVMHQRQLLPGDLPLPSSEAPPRS